MTLEERFVDFIRSLKNAEIIDDLELNDEQMKAQKPDFFFCDRQFIGEMKSVKIDMEPKANSILERHKNRPDYPLFFGSRDSNKVLGCLRDGDHVKNHIFREITSAIKENVKKANGQIRDAKVTFKLSESRGILIILNDLVEILSPNLILHKVHQLMNEKLDSGAPRYPNISAVLIISETHFVKTTSSDQKLLPIIQLIDDSLPDYQEIQDYLNWIIKKWSLFHNIPLHETNIDVDTLMNNLVILKGGRELDDHEEISRGQAFINQYRMMPYLRNMSEENLMNHGQQIWYESSLAFLKGTHEKPSQERTHELIELGTHFNEEMNYRGIDYRKFSPYLQDACERLILEGIIKRHE